MFLKQNVNFQKNGLLPQNQKKIKEKLSKEISMRDHSENKKIPKKCTLFYVSKPRVTIPQENKQNKKKSLKNGKNQKKFFYFQFIFFEIILAKVIQIS
jgi:hypothetical protein